MATIEEIDKAIGAHALWKSRLRMTIESGRIDMPVDSIRRDDQCDFGKWLLGKDLGAADRETPEYRAVSDLHARFHKTAARVVELALSGRRAEAETMMILGGEYAAISDRLTEAMIDWKRVSPHAAAKPAPPSARSAGASRARR
jgi:hypothetical protein